MKMLTKPRKRHSNIISTGSDGEVDRDAGDFDKTDKQMSVVKKKTQQ